MIQIQMFYLEDQPLKMNTIWGIEDIFFSNNVDFSNQNSTFAVFFQEFCILCIRGHSTNHVDHFFGYFFTPPLSLSMWIVLLYRLYG